MGYWKQIMEELGGGNPLPYLDTHVCADCIDDRGLRAFIKDNAREKSCTFCQKTSDVSIAAQFTDLLIYIEECIRREYDFAENCLPYESAEGGYIGEVWSTQEILDQFLGEELPNDQDGVLMESLCDGLGDRAWCRASPFSLSYDEQMRFSWDGFCQLIKYRRRYFFLYDESGDREIYSPYNLLRELEKSCEKIGLYVKLPAGSILYRSRFQPEQKIFDTVISLGPPPPDRSIKPNRMSPPGIVMFYVSDNADTALREVAKHPNRDEGHYAVGKFRTLRDVKIFDLSNIPPVPSIFEHIPDSMEYDPRPVLVFLHYFAAEISRPAGRDHVENIDYTPSQIVTEYFRAVATHEGTRISGIRYSSARHAHHSSIVLFANQDNLAGGRTSALDFPISEDDRWIEMIHRSERIVTEKELRLWNDESPMPFSWV